MENQETRIIITGSFYDMMVEVLDKHSKIQNDIEDFFNDVYPIPTPHKTFGWVEITEAELTYLEEN